MRLQDPHGNSADGMSRDDVTEWLDSEGLDLWDTALSDGRHRSALDPCSEHVHVSDPTCEACNADAHALRELMLYREVQS